MRYILLLIIVIFTRCSLNNFDYTFGLSTGAKIITILVDRETYNNEINENYYIKIGDKVYKVIADKDVRSVITFQCGGCGLIFGIKPSEKDYHNMATLCCPRCRKTMAVLHEVIASDNIDYIRMMD